MKKSMLLFLPLIYSCNVYANKNLCSEKTSANNAFNNAILAQEWSAKKTPKKISMRITSKDDYISADSQVEFDDCGTLLHSRAKKTVRSQINKSILVIQFSSTLDKNHSNWDYSSTFNMSMIENDNARHELMAQEISGTVLTDGGGRIVRSEEASDLLIKQKHQSSKAVTTYLADDAGRLSKTKRVSTLGNDSGNTVYSYGAKNLLIRTKSGTTTADFTYDNDDRELTSKEVMKSFTTETTTTTCKSWNKFGRCINAQQNISILIKDVKKNRDNVYDHVAEIKYDYVY
ncbi:hypothetical protein V1234_16460 [Serratia marcescens]|uniref:hypothetical protein n=1 Tax=Serratia TaxID=613 RepID=UPI001EE3C27A|nr:MULTISPECIES: hypothetical protein [Serratia]WVJ40386.1 hypothetical protein V1234_16460 [Serratia marcescens]BEO23970.1 hypothetical protein SMQC20_25540 [Serratia marcescens]